MRELIIYRKGKFGSEPLGDLTDVRVGDAVRYLDENGANATSRVAKVNVKAGVLRTEPQMYNEYVLRTAKTLKFDQILGLTRKDTGETDGASSSPIMDIVHPIPEQPRDPSLPPPPPEPKKKKPSLLRKRSRL